VGVATGLGIAFGDLIHTVMATFGLSAILATSALAFAIVKYAGVAYLVFRGIRALLEKTGDLHFVHTRLLDAPGAFRQGIVAEVLNPKTALFFLAFLPQFVRPDNGSVITQFLILGSIFVAMSAVYISLVALGAGQAGKWLNRQRRIGRWQKRLVGTIYLALGVRLALQDR
jgi:threonine/homoserine/homoserine lactone efflux protein